MYDMFFDCCFPGQLFIPESFEECFTYAQQILWLKQYIDNIDPGQAPDLTEIKARLDAVESDIQNINGEIPTITTEINNIKSQLTSITATQTQHTADIADLRETKQNTLAAGTNVILEPQPDGTVRISATGGGTVTLDDTVTADSQNGVKSSGIYTAVQAVQENVNTVNQTVTEHTSDLQDIDRDIQQLQTATSTLNQTISSVQTTVTTQGESLATLNQTVQEQDADITALDQKTTQQEKDIQQAKTDIAANQTNINAILSDYVKESTYSPFVQQTNTSLTEHTQRITDLQDDKQNKLVAGDNITLTPQTDGTVQISSTGGGGTVTLDDTVTETSANAVKSSGIYSAISAAKTDVLGSMQTEINRLDATKQNKLVAGDNITITPSTTETGKYVISSTGGGGSTDDWYDLDSAATGISVTHSTLVEDGSFKIQYSPSRSKYRAIYSGSRTGLTAAGSTTVIYVSYTGVFPARATPDNIIPIFTGGGLFKGDFNNVTGYGGVIDSIGVDRNQAQYHDIIYTFHINHGLISSNRFFILYE